MTAPRATYRLQFRNGMTFERGAALAGYLARLGISHLYASPLFAAVPGSTHGYDGIDMAAMEPAIGGEDGFDRLSAALADAGLELLLDFVPNHMAAADGNGWWRAVLEWGSASPFAAVFDIDWSAPKVILPILGSSYDDALRGGAFGIAFDTGVGSLAFTYGDRRLPLTPPSYGRLLARAGDPAVAALAPDFAAATVDDAEALKRRLSDLVAEPAPLAALGDAAASASVDPALLHEIHEAQVWRLVHWRLARTTLTHRRFFEIADLICLRVDDPAVFEKVHARLFALIAAGRIAGVRLDHIDGLADPKTYLEHFQRTAGGAAPCYLLVEKILDRDERLRRDWPVAGTTGYEFIAALAGLLVDERGEAAMTHAYESFMGTWSDYPADARAAKREILEHNLAAELAVLTDRARGLAADDFQARDLGADALRRAIVELAAALPVYRTYVNAAGPDHIDRALVAGAADDAKTSCTVEDGATVDFIARLLLLDADRPTERDRALEFACRFQQTTGPVMAKAVEDTLFYRYNRLIALNEVGGAPDRFGAPVSAFHAAMSERLQSRPGGLSATSTHDTKRGEDARARLYVLGEMPQAWQRAVARWAAMNARYRAELAGRAAPEPAIEWFFYQALAGAWPADLIRETPARDDEPALAALRRRMGAFMEKAVREAKMRTSWTDPDPAYEAAVVAFVNAVLSPGTGGGFLADFARTCGPLWIAGAVNGLAQLAVKLAAPGVPDFYQGAELWDFSLVDPDNRSPVDFAVRERLLEAIADAEPASLLEDWTSGAPKMALTAAGLRARTERPALFAAGTYTGLAASGAHARHIVAFTRMLDGAFAVVVVPRLILTLTEGSDRPLVPAPRWDDTVIILPEELRGRPMRDVVTGAVHDGSDVLAAATVLDRFPVAFLVDAE